MATQLIIDYAYDVLPHLIRQAQLRETIKYGELALKARLPHHRPLNQILGYIRDEICSPRKLPMLTVLVVNQYTGLPGESFLEEGTSHLDSDAYKERFEQEFDKAFVYPNWDQLLIELGLKPVNTTESEFDQEAAAYNQIYDRHGKNGGEGPLHENLKLFIAKQPQIIGVSALKKPELEVGFLSGDRCDILIELFGNKKAIVEIKVGQRGELIKGIYQLVKYQAVLQAQLTHGGTYPIDLYLVAYDIPNDIQEFANKFGIQCFTIKRELVR